MELKESGLLTSGMRTGRLAITLALSAFAIAACTKGSFTQDPLANQDDAIKKAVKPGQDKAKINKPVESDALRIDSDDFFSFKEGVDSGAKLILARLLTPVEGQPAKAGVDFDLSIKNLQDFPGATFDPLTGNFAWVPPQGTVDNGMMRETQLIVEVYTRATPILTRSKKINIFVTRDASDPEIVSISGLSGRLHEGDLTEFTITVKDPDSVNNDAGRPRLLIVSGTAGKSNIAQWVAQSSTAQTNPVQDPTDPNKWVYTMRLDLRDAEVTNDEGNYDFGVIVVNRSGLTSSPMKQSVRIATSVRKPQITWRDAIEIVSGQPNTTNFTAFDPQGEGAVSVLFNNCPTGATCNCYQPSYGRGSAQCSVSWKPSATTRTSDYTLSLTVTNTSANYSDPNLKSTVQFNPRFHILPGGTPAPLSER